MIDKADAATAPLGLSRTGLPTLAHIVFYGQSLSVGYMGIPALSTAATALGYRFKAGVRSLDAFHTTPDGGDPVITEEVEPLRETELAMFGETPATACVRMIEQLLADEDGLTPEGVPLRFLMTAPGANTMSVAELSSQNAFEGVKSNALLGVQAARTLQRSYRLSALAWIQGESDYVIGTPPDEYARSVRRLRSTVGSIRTGMDPTAPTLPMLVTQTATHRAAGRERPTIGLAQLELGRDENIALACVAYALPFWPNDVHLAAAGYQWLGAYHGLALKRWLFDGVKPRHLDPLRARAVGTSIEVEFDVPGGSLTLDTDAVVEQPAFGFTVVGGDGAELPIQSVRLAGPSTVELQLESPERPPLAVRYAWTGDGMKGLGNLRDSAGDMIRYRAEGYELPLHNWAPIFELTVDAG